MKNRHRRRRHSPPIVVASGGLAVAGNSALAAGDADKVQGKAQAAKTSAKTSGGPQV